MKPQIFGAIPLKQDATLHNTIMRLYRVAKRHGEFPAERKDPTGDELLLWMAETPDSHPVAFATFYEAKPRLIWLDLIWVSPEHRRKGLAKAMLILINGTARRMKMESIQFGTTLDNDAMRATGRLVGFGEEMVIMERKL